MSEPRQLTVEQALSQAKKATKKGDTTLALQLYNAVLQHHPNHPVANKGLRKLQKKSRQSQFARSIDPSLDQINSLIHLCRLGRMARVEQDGRKLLKTYPQSMVLMNILGVALQRQGKLGESLQVFDQVLRGRPDFAEAHSNRGIALRELGQLHEAIVSFDQAIRLKPSYAEAYYNRGNAQKDLGQLEKAVASYNKAIELVPGFAQAHRTISALKKYQSGDPQVELMEKLLASSALDESMHTELCFALAKAYEDLEEHDKTFDRLEEGNRLRRKEIHYDIADDRELFRKIRDVFVAGCPVSDVVSHDKTSIQTIFIVGMMRSGTSLVEQILASHSEVHGAGELETMNHLMIPILSNGPDVNAGQNESKLSAAMIETARSGYLEALRALDVPETLITDKMPLNFRWIGFILSAFPDAKIVHLVRDPRATCWSIYKHYFPHEGNGYAYDLQDLAEFYNLYSELMAFWHDRYPDRIYDLCYEDLTENQEEQTRKLLAFCGLAWEQQCLDFHVTSRVVKTSSAAQIRQPMYQGSSEAWKRYERHLESLLSGLRL